MDKLQSIRETLKGGYTKPDPSRISELITGLEISTKAQDYLHIKRGLSKDTISHFKLGYDVTRDAISIPVFKRDELINIRYRYINPESKKRYSQEKGCEVWLYNEDGISKAMKKGAVLCVEGEFDLMSCWQAGFKAVISPASGKDSYGPWVELLDNIPKTYIFYDNDKPGKSAGLKLSERIGVDKCLEGNYPDGIKDANEFFSTKTREDFIPLIQNAKPYYKYKFKGIGDIIDKLKIFKDTSLKLKLLPFVEMEEDWIGMIAGRNNSGKTSYVLNIANELIEKNIPTLLLPYERGIISVGKRFLQIRYNKSKKEINATEEKEWDDMILDSVNLPLYFSMPNESEFKDTIIRAKRIFNTQVVIIDHLDYFIDGADSISKQADTIKLIKEIALENNIIFLVVHQLRKEQMQGAIPKKPTRADLVGSGKLSDIPEFVALLNKPDEGKVEIIIDKNKGEMGSKIFNFNTSTGVVSESEEDKEFNNF